MKQELLATGVVALFLAVVLAAGSLLSPLLGGDAEREVSMQPADAGMAELVAFDAEAADQPQLRAGGDWMSQLIPGYAGLPQGQQALVFMGYPFALAALVALLGAGGGAACIWLLTVGRRRWRRHTLRR